MARLTEGDLDPLLSWLSRLHQIPLLDEASSRQRLQQQEHHYHHQAIEPVRPGSAPGDVSREEVVVVEASQQLLP